MSLSPSTKPSRAGGFIPLGQARRLAVVCALFAFCCAPVSAQFEQERIVPKFGTQGFQGFLAQFGLQPLDSVTKLKDVSPNETLIIVFGANEVLDDIRKAIGGLKPFLENGGAILVATNEATGTLQDDFDLSIPGGMVKEDEQTAFLGQQNCPMIKVLPDRRHPLTHGISIGIATNMPSYIMHAPNGKYRRLAVFSPNSSTELNGFPLRPLVADPVFPRDEQRWRLFVGGNPYIVASPWDAPPAGRVVVMSGHLAFTNLMMHFVDDNDNMRFARQSVKWLSESPLEPPIPGRSRYRKYVLFVDDGRVVTKLDGPISIPPPPVVDLLNKLLYRLEQENYFNRKLHDHVPPYRIWQVVILITTLCLFLWGARRLIKARFYVEREATRLAEGLAGYPVNKHNEKWTTAPLTEQRHRTQRKRGDFWDTLHQLARHFFREYVGVDHFDTAETMPLSVQGSWKQRRHLEELWSLAVGRNPQTTSAGKLRSMMRQMDALAQQMTVGALVMNGKSPLPSRERGDD